jgi:TatD DNase family protein
MARGTSESPPLIDTHAHLDDPKLAKDEAGVLTRAREAGVAGIVSVGADLTSSRAAIELAAREDMVRATVGIHPHDAGEVTEDTWAALEELAGDDQVVAVGECGLDYYRDLSPRETQRAVFARHLALAQAVELPVVVHCREAYEDCLDILDAECSPPIRGVLHCFQGDAAVARQTLELGLLIGLGGSLTLPREQELRQVVAELSIDRIVLETDAPYLTPRPKRGRNEPAYVRFVASRLAELHGVSQHRVAQATTENAVRLFGLPRHT